MIYAVILAGGSGTRLWPYSRECLPKQFLHLTGQRTMLQQSVDRIAPLVPIDQVLIVTHREHISTVREQLPELPASNVIGEPAGRGTAPAIGLAALLLHRHDPDAMMIVLTADHIIRKEGEFHEILRIALKVAADGWLVTLGITPSAPETGYGYIEKGAPLSLEEKHTVYRVARFAEKPDIATATAFVQSGNYVWNSGMFIWRADAILEEMHRQMRETHAQLQQIASALSTPAGESVLGQIWPRIAKQTIDYGVMEHALRVAVVPADIGWNDVGSWSSLLDLMPADADGNALYGEVAALETRNSLLYSNGRLIATIGLEDMIVVSTTDVTLICPRNRAQDVRQIVEELKRQGKHQYL